MAAQQIVEPRMGALSKEIGVLSLARLGTRGLGIDGLGMGRSDFWNHEGHFRCVQSMIDGRESTTTTASSRPLLGQRRAPRRAPGAFAGQREARMRRALFVQARAAAPAACDETFDACIAGITGRAKSPVVSTTAREGSAKYSSIALSRIRLK